MNFQLAIPSAVTLAETPIWDERIGKLYWTDLFTGDVNQFDPETGAKAQWKTGQLIGSAVPCETLGKLLVVIESGVHVLDQATGALTLVAHPEESGANRYNDARVDAAGRVLLSSVAKTYGTDAYTPDQVGGFYLVDTDRSVKTLVAGINQYNAICWSGDNTKMFVVDTYNQKLLCFDYDLAVGPVSGPREVIDFAAQGMPDGMCMDEEDNLYIAHWTGRLSVWDRDLKLREEIPFPVEQVCCPGFGGRDGRDLYVATASYTYTPEDFAKNPGAGGLFVARSDIRGRMDHFFK